MSQKNVSNAKNEEIGQLDGTYVPDLSGEGTSMVNKYRKRGIAKVYYAHSFCESHDKDVERILGCFTFDGKVILNHSNLSEKLLLVKSADILVAQVKGGKIGSDEVAEILTAKKQGIDVFVLDDFDIHPLDVTGVEAEIDGMNSYLTVLPEQQIEGYSQ